VRLALKTALRPEAQRDTRRIYRDTRKACVRLTPPLWPERSPYYGNTHTHVVEISDEGNGWTDRHPDGSRHRVTHLEVMPATHPSGAQAFDRHRHDIAGRANR
jgi:hypothetical protein